MNKTFHSVWNASKHAYVAAAETVSAKGKPTSGVKVATVVASLLGSLLGTVANAQTAPPVNALPTGGQVSAGQAAISQNGASMVINQATDRAAIHWNTFNVGSQAQVQFNQPSAASVTLNRVMSSDPSQIFGRITANGQVILTNPSGVYFGPSARVDVGGLVATTMGMSDADFMAGNNRYQRNGSTASVVNEGELKATLGGYIALLAPEVRNQGAVIAQMGTVALASGEAVNLRFDSNNRLTSLRVEPSQIQALVDNQHAVQAPGGLIIISAQSMDRLVGGVVKNSGSLEANSLTSKGGRIVLEADHIELQSTSRIDASGATGGGTVLVGGDWQGSGDMHQATSVSMAAGATIDASATQQGDGGKVVLWTDIHNDDAVTEAHGTIQARGGKLGGNGGQIETSGHYLNTSGAQGSAAAYHGMSGQWLFDPYNITVDTLTSSGGSFSSGSWTPSATSTISNTQIQNLLNAGTSVTLDTGASGSAGSDAGNITINAAITANGAAGLTLRAAGDVTNNAAIWIAGPIMVYGNSITLNNNADLTSTATSGTGVLLQGSKILQNASVDVRTSGSHITYSVTNSPSTTAADYGIRLYGTTSTSKATIDARGGNISLSASYATSGTAGLSDRAIELDFASIMTRGAGTITLTGDASNNPNTSNNAYGIGFNTASGSPADSTTLIQSENGAINISGTPGQASSTAYGIYNGNKALSILSASGAITLNDIRPSALDVSIYDGLYLQPYVSPNNIFIGSDGTTVLTGTSTSSSSNVTINADKVTFAAQTGNVTQINTSGTVTIRPNSADFGSPLNTTNLALANTVSGLTIGKPDTGADGTADADVTIGRATTIAGPISIFGGAVTIAVDLISTATTGTGISITGARITQNAGVSVSTSGTDISYTASGGTFTSGDDKAISIGATSGSRSTLDAGGGKITLSGSWGTTGVAGATNGDFATWVFGTDIKTTGAGTITITGDATNTTTTMAAYGINLGVATLIQSENGAITLTGTGGKASNNSRGVVIDSQSFKVLSSSGGITLKDVQPAGLTGTYTGMYLAPSSSDNIYLGSDGSTQLSGSSTASSSNITLQVDRVSFLPNNSFKTLASTSGAVVVEPVGSSFSSAQTMNTSSLDITGTPSSVRLGKDGNTATIVVGSAITAAGPIGIYGGNIAINEGLVSTSDTGVITLKGSGNVTDGTNGYVQAGSQTTMGQRTGSLLLLGGNVTLDNSANNDVGTMAASGVGGLTYLDYAGLFVSTVGTTSGVTATGVVNIGTKLYSLAVEKDITTTSTSANALTLNASIDSAVGSDLLSNVLIRGNTGYTPTISVGSGGIGRIYTGGITSDSQRVSQLSSLTSGHFRYNSDETTTNYTTALSSGIYAIYREQPSVSGTISSETITYGQSTPTFTLSSSSLQNGDGGSAFSISSAAYSTANKLKAGTYTVTASGLSDLGYAVGSITNGTLTVNQLALTGSISTGSSTYGSALSAGTPTLTNAFANDLLGTATIAVDTTGNLSSSNHLKAGSYTNIESITALSGTDASNYTFANVKGNYTVSQLALTGAAIAGVSTSYGTAANAGAVSFGNVVSGDTVTTTASIDSPLYSTSNHLKAGSYTQTASTTLGGADAGNYSFTGFTSAANYVVNQLALNGVIATGSSTYGAALVDGAVTYTNLLNQDLLSAPTLTLTTTGNTSTSGKLKAGSHTAIQSVSALNGTDAANYSIGTFTGGNYTVNPLALTGSITGGGNTYGSAQVAGTFTFGNQVTGDIVAAGPVSINTTGLLSSSGNLKAGTHSGIQSVGTTLTGTDASNYTFAGSTADYTVSQLALTGAAIAGVSTSYGTAANAGAVSFGNVVSGDTVTTTASIDSPLYSTSNHLKAGSYTQTASTTLGGADAGNYSFTGFTSAANYVVNQLALNGVIATGSSTYGAALVDGAVTYTNLLNQDLLGAPTLTFTTTGNTSTSGKLKAGSYTAIQSVSALNGTDAANYSIGTFTGGNYTVNPLALTGSITGGGNTYGSAQVAGTFTFGNQVTGDIVAAGPVSINTTGLLSSSGNLKAGTHSGIQSVGTTLTGTDAGNYTFAGSTADYTVSQLALTGAAIAGVSTSYGTAANAGAVSFGNVVSGDTVTGSASIVSTAGDLSTSNHLKAGSYTQTASTTLGGADAGNYSFAGFASAANYVVNPLNLSVTGVTAENKIYDANTAATLAGGSISPLSGDSVTLSSNAASGSFANATVGSGKTVTVSGYTLSGNDAGNYSIVQPTGVTANMSKAMLTVTANNDAKFLTQSDVGGYSGVSYSGFVGGETAGTAAGFGAPTLSRSNSSTNTAGTYSGVLVPTGASATNYDFTYVNGSYTIVPSNQLLVRVNNVTSTYGSATQYALTSVEYFDGSAVVRLDNGSVNGSSTTINANNQVAVNDGASGTASFTLAPVSGQFSTANKLKVGGYQLGTSGTVAENSVNFSDTITVVGAHQVNAKALTASASGVSKTYDGNTSMSGVTLDLSGKETSDLVTVSGSGAFSQKNVGTSLGYTISNLTLDGTDGGNYYLSGGSSLSGNNGAITAKALSITYSASNKVYDGGTSVLVASSDNRIIGDALNLSQTAAFTDKNVATGKTVNISGISLSGADAGNYSLSSTTASTTANITRLNSVTWIGGSTGNWFDPANWAGGAVPDLSNVANVVIPAGVTVSFGTTSVSPADASLPVNLDSLGSSSGSLTQSGGTLNLGSGGMQLANYTQSGGTLSNSGNTVLNSLTQTGGSLSVGGDLTVNTGFSQGSSGTISVGGNTSITDTSGGAALGNLSSMGTLTVNSTDGSITQVNGTTLVIHGTSNFTASTGTSPNQMPANITLDGANNDFVDTVSANGNNVTLSDVNDLSAILNASGNGTLTAGGDLTVSGNSGDLTTTSGGATSFGGIIVHGNLNTTSAGHISQTGPLTVSGTTSLDASGNNVTLNNANNDFVGSVNANGANIALTDANSLTLGNIHASGTLNAAASQNITINGTVNADSLDLTATHGDISQTNGGTLVVINGPSNLNAGGDITLGGRNDFNGSVNANGGNISINDINSLTLGNINAANRFDVTAGGNIAQDSSNGKKIVVGGVTHITTPGDVVLDSPANQMPKGVVIQARSARVVGDSRKATAEAQAKVNGSAPTRTMPGTGLSNTAIPQPLVLVAEATSTSTSSSNAVAGAASSSVNSAGVTVDVHNLHQESVPLMVAVSLPKGASTVGTGFTFELPESVQSMPGARESIELTQMDGNTLPAWLKFDQALMRFEASAVPNSALPMQLMALVGGKRVTVVISERTE